MLSGLTAFLIGINDLLLNELCIIIELTLGVTINASIVLNC